MKKLWVGWMIMALTIADAATTPVRVERSADQKTLIVDCSDVAIGEILHEVASVCDLAVVAPDIAGRTSIKLSGVTWQQVYKEILTPLTCTFVEDGGVIRVCTIKDAVRIQQRLDVDFPQPDVPESARKTFDFAQVEIRTVLRAIGDAFDLNLVVPEELSGRITVRLRNVTWREALRESLRPLGYTFTDSQGIVRVLEIPRQWIPESVRTYHLPTSLIPSPGWLSVLIAALPHLLIVPIAFLHLILFIGVVRLPLPVPPVFAPKAVWAVLVLLGGVLPLLAYWLLHFSSLARPGRQSPPS